MCRKTGVSMKKELIEFTYAGVVVVLFYLGAFLALFCEHAFASGHIGAGIIFLVLSAGSLVGAWYVRRVWLRKP